MDLNATQAYRAAFPGCGYKAARVAGCRFLTKAKIRAELRAARAAQERRTLITADKALREIARVAFSDVLDLFGDDGQLLSTLSWK